MEINAKMVKELREKTGIGIMKCKEALKESSGDMEKAIEYLRKKGLSDASKRMGRSVKEGKIDAYIHFGGKVGAMAELYCESDFVAKTEDFQQLLKDILMQIASENPLYLQPEDIPEEVLEKEKEIYKAQMADSGKPDHILDKIAEGKLKKFYQQVCLLDQPFIKDNDVTIRELIKGKIAKIGENIKVGRFARFRIGEES